MHFLISLEVAGGSMGLRDIKGQMLTERRNEVGKWKGSSEGFVSFFGFLKTVLVKSCRLLLGDCCTFDSRNS